MNADPTMRLRMTRRGRVLFALARLAEFVRLGRLSDRLALRALDEVQMWCGDELGWMRVPIR